MTTTANRPEAQVVDTGTAFGAKVAERLERESVLWLTTVGPTGTPQPNPVWFHWDNDEFLIFSKPDQAKVRNIGRHPRVSVNLNANKAGNDVVVLTGTARVDEAGASAAESARFVTKYQRGLADISMTAEQFFAEYTVTVRITPDRLRGF